MAFTNIRPQVSSRTQRTLQSLGSILQECRLPTGVLTEFAKVLLKVALNLTKDEFSLMKLALIANDNIQTKNADNISCAADLLSFMYTRKYINKDDLSLLMELLAQVQRQDLHEVVYNYLQYQMKEQVKPLSGAHLNKISVSDSLRFGQQCSGSIENAKDTSDNMDHDPDLPNSQNSQSSLSDDDKMNQLEKTHLESYMMDTYSQ